MFYLIIYRYYYYYYLELKLIIYTTIVILCQKFFYLLFLVQFKMFKKNEFITNKNLWIYLLTFFTKVKVF